MKILGLIGCGAIGTLIIQAIEKDTIPCEKLILFDIDVGRAEKLASSIHTPVHVVRNLEGMLRLNPYVIVEAASQDAVKEYARIILDSNIHLVVMSVGALLDMDLSSKQLHFSSGAIGGLDAIATAELAGATEICLTTRKNPTTLNLYNKSEETVFVGGPREAIARFPREMNVAAVLALTAKDSKINVQVISDPKVKKNVHEIKVSWKHGEMFLRFSNDPHPSNPKTSALAAWSAVRLLRELLKNDP